MTARAALLALAVLLVAAPTSADAVIVTRAMTASTIMEVFVDDESILVELEIGANDQAVLRQLLTAATSAPQLPTPIPTSAGLSIRADGRRLNGKIEEIVRRKRMIRDEVSGEPLPNLGSKDAVPNLGSEDAVPNLGSEEVVFLKLRYPLRIRPKKLVVEPPLTPDGYPTTDIGFVVYHHGIAVNDFRYLAAGELLYLDWDDPFYSRFDRRTLNRKYGSPMNIFLYVEPFEVRKEFVVRPLDLARFTDIDVEAHKPIPAGQRDDTLRKLAAFLKDRARVTIDGQQPEPILDRIHFLKRGLRMTRVVTPDEPVDGTSAIVGAIFVYPVAGIPKDVRLTWDIFDERITRVPASATDEAGPMPSFLTPDDPELHWVNYLKGGTLPGELVVAAPRSHLSIPIAVLGAALLALVFLAIAIRRRSWALALAAITLAAAGWLASPTGDAPPTWEVGVPPTGDAPPTWEEVVSTWEVRVPVPAGVRAPSGDEARPTIHALLYNVYRALDFRQEEIVFDRLAQSLSGDVLERVYLEMRKGLRLENQGGARVRVREVDVLDATPQEATRPDTLRYRTRWNATGSVGHWGHTHMRTNSYDAVITLGRMGEQWKIADIDILEEQRIVAGQR